MRKYFLPGLVILLPIALTFFILQFFLNLLTQPFVGFVSEVVTSYHIMNKGFLIFSQEQLIRFVSQLIILISLFLFILVLGFLARWFLFRALIRLGEKIMRGIPLVNKIYQIIQEITQSLFSEDKQSFSQVALVPFPREGLWAIGLVAGKAPHEAVKQMDHPDDYVSVFIPTSPTPASGFVVICKRCEMKILPYKVDQALKFIVSCGIIPPEEA